MAKINVTFADDTIKNIVVHTRLAYEVQPVIDLKVNDNL